jgi:hypothetical protein
MTKEPTLQTALLHNMSMRPRTTVTATMSVVGEALARFAVTPKRLRTLLDDPSLPERLEQRWQEAGLCGALHVYPLPEPALTRKVPVLGADPLLALNVLGRTRAGLLLPGAPLDLDPLVLGRQLASDDPRLVELASTEGGRR